MDNLELAFSILSIILTIILILIAWRHYKKKPEKDEIKIPHTQHQQQHQTVIIMPPKSINEMDVIKEKNTNLNTDNPTNISDGENKKWKMNKKILFDKTVIVPAGGQYKIPFNDNDLETNDIIEGLLDEKNRRDFNYFWLDKKNLVKQRNREDYTSLDDDDGEIIYDIKFKVKKSGDLWLVLDCYGKQNDREVHVYITQNKTDHLV